MVKSEAVIYGILGPTRKEIDGLARSVEVMMELVFLERKDMGKIKLSRHIYPQAAQRCGKSPGAVSRGVQRLVNACWEEGDREYLKTIVDWEYPIRDVKEMLLCLAFYCYLGEPYFKVMREDPMLVP